MRRFSNELVAAKTTEKFRFAAAVPETAFGLNQVLPRRGQVQGICGIGAAGQIRMVHTADMEVPDFSSYRSASGKDSTVNDRDAYESRASVAYLMSGATAVAGAYAASSLVNQFLGSLSPSADVLALAKIEINLNDIPVGRAATFKWRGKPLFIRHRFDDRWMTPARPYPDPIQSLTSQYLIAGRPRKLRRRRPWTWPP